MSHEPGSGAHPPPPDDIEEQRELFFPSRPFRFYPIALGVALGCAAVIFMTLSMVIALNVDPAGMQFFRDVFPGFTLMNWSGRLMGLVWAFGTGLILGTFTGLIYNLSLRTSVPSAAFGGTHEGPPVTKYTIS